MEYIVSNPGSRETNEDSYNACDIDNGKLYLVADGCGGHGFGEVASAIVVDALPQLMLEDEISEDSIKNAIKRCNVRILEKQSQYKGMRSTVAGLYMKTSHILAFNVGDSRIYQIRDGKAVFISEDHSVPYLLYKAGIISFDEISEHEDRNKILEALGNKDSIKINAYTLEMQNKDIFVLASDGFWENITNELWKKLIPGNEKQWLDECCCYIDGKNDAEQDNYTAIVVESVNE